LIKKIRASGYGDVYTNLGQAVRGIASLAATDQPLCLEVSAFGSPGQAAGTLGVFV